MKTCDVSDFKESIELIVIWESGCWHGCYAPYRRL